MDDRFFLIVSIIIIIGCARELWKIAKHHFKHQKYYHQLLTLMQQLFADVNPFQISRDNREEHQGCSDILIYGEITYPSLTELLAIVEPKSNEIFYDLGAGAGKAVLWASLLHPWRKCCGIELLPALHQLSVTKKNEFINTSLFRNKKTKPEIELIQGDMLAEDFSEANVIFINATCFDNTFWSEILAKLTKAKPGVRVITVTQHLKSLSCFDLITAGMYQMSWGLSSVYVYRKVT